MAKITQEQLKKMSIEELNQALVEAKNRKAKVGLELRSQQSHELSTYKNDKLLIAQIKTELRARQLTN